MTNKEIIALYEGLNKIFNRQELRFPAKVSFAMTRNFRNLASIVEDVNIARDGVLQTYGIPMEDKPGYYSIPPENREKAQEELNALNNMEQDITLLKVSLPDLDGMELSLDEMNALYEMLEE